MADLGPPAVVRWPRGAGLAPVLRLYVQPRSHDRAARQPAVALLPVDPRDAAQPWAAERKGGYPHRTADDADDGDLSPLRTWPDLAGLVGGQWLGSSVPVPFLESLPSGHPLHAEWVNATGSPMIMAP